jgi:hypothetical protein
MRKESQTVFSIDSLDRAYVVASAVLDARTDGRGSAIVGAMACSFRP